MNRTILLATLFLSAIAYPVCAQECVDFRDYTHITATVTTPGIGSDLVVSGNYAYLAARSGGLQIIDISGSADPSIVGSLVVDTETPALAEANGLIYLAAEEAGVVIVDVTAPDAPVQIGSVSGFSYALDIAVTGSTALVADLIGWKNPTGAIVIVDVSDAGTASIVSRIPQSTQVMRVDGDGQIGVASASIGLIIFDYSSPATPHVIATLPLPYGVRCVAMAGNRAYVTTGHDDGLYIVDISDPAAPAVTNTIAPRVSGGEFKEVSVVDDQLLISGWGTGFCTFDLSNPDLPVLTSQIYTTYGHSGMSADRNHIYGAIGTPGGLVVMNQGLPPTELVTPVASGFDKVIATRDDLAIIGEYESKTLDFLDISDPRNPVLLGTHLLTSFPAEIEIVADKAFCTTYGDGLTILDLADPANPSKIGFIALTEPRDLVISGTTAFVANGPDGLAVIDISNVSAPVVIGNFPTANFAAYLAVEAGYAYLGVWWESVLVLDISNPTAPTLVAEIAAKPSGLFAADGMLYLADTYLGLRLIDVTFPATPATMAELQMPYEPIGLTVEDRIVYIADDWGGLAAVDTRNPTDPQFLGGAFVPFAATDVSVSGDWVFVASTTGLYALPKHCSATSTVDRITVPAAGSILPQNFPNPFNPQTTIAFELPSQTTVNLRVFDLSGRLVRTLVEGEIIAEGRHESIWNGRDGAGRRVASGTYFYRLEAGEYSETKRMALIK